jgi:LacI family transcriptional regulator
MGRQGQLRMAKKRRTEHPHENGTAKALSLRRLAELAAVDVSTVSRALNHDRRISAERARAIRRLAEKIGYRPRPLRARQTKAIGVLIASQRPDRLDEPFLERVALTAERVLNARHLHVHLECVRRDDPDSPSLPAIVRENRVDGVLWAGHPQVELVRKVAGEGMPAVAINDSVERLGICCVRTAPESAIRELVLRLAANGHQRFALLTTDLAFPTVKARYESYAAALRELAIAPAPGSVLCGLSSGIAGGREGARKLLQLDPRPSAIICCNDWMALGVLHELQRRGLAVPDAASVVGHDDLPFCEELEPTLTSVRRSEDALVTQAADFLLELIEHPGMEAREARVEEQVVWRGSSGLAPARRGNGEKEKP